MIKAVKETVPVSVAAGLADINQKISSIEATLEDAVALQSEVANIKKETSKLKNETLPGLVAHLNKTVTQLALRDIDLNMHRRKWSVIFQGVSGNANEESDITRRSILAVAKNKLKLKDTRDAPLREDQLAACHRLQSASDSAIIARFVDLKQRDRWLSHAKNLAGSNISMSVDVPPCLRKAKKELMALRKELAPAEKKKAFIKYLPSWPYLVLHRKDQEPVHHTFSKAQIIEQSLGLSDGESVFEIPNG